MSAKAKKKSSAQDAVTRYFSSIDAALDGLDIYLRDGKSPFYQHGLVAQTVTQYIARLANSFLCWNNRLDYEAKFKISRADSGFPIFQNVLLLEKDRQSAQSRLAAIPDPATLRAEMADFILRHKEFPAALKKSMVSL